ncbi:MFS transporter [Kitasatospora xanthocidica]|uniref:MFS transporter n=1 Tax=Kitasatospora xanthocidica TaxID=83382 RepID=UPI0036EBEFE9
MTSDATGTRPEDGVHRARLTREQRLYLLAMTIDNVGNGLWAPLALIFFTRAQHLSLGATGTALTAGGLVGLVAGPLGGSLIDRWGPEWFVLLGNVARAGVFVTYPVITSPAQVAVATCVFSASDRLFWTANTPMLARLTPAGDLTRILGAQNVLRIGGWAAGGGIGAALGGLLIGHASGLHLLAYANAATYLAAAVLMAAVRRSVRRPDGSGAAGAGAGAGPGREEEAPGGRRTLSTDRRYQVFCLLQVQFALISESLTVMLPLVALDVMHGPSWLPGAAVVTTCLSLVLFQRSAVRYGRSRSPAHSLRLACAAFASAFLLLAPAGPLGPSWAVPVVLCAALVGTAGDALFAPVMTAAAHEAAPEELKGRYSAAFQLAWGVAGTLAPVIGARLMTVGNSVLWLTMLGGCAVTAPVVGRVLRPPASAPAPEEEASPARSGG